MMKKMDVNTPPVPVKASPKQQNELWRPLLRVIWLFYAGMFYLLPGAVGQNCPAPESVSVASVGADKITLFFGGALTNGAFRAGWAEMPGNRFIYKTFDAGTQGEISNLKPGTQYLLRIDRVCNTANTYSPALSLGTIRTLTKEEEQLLCAPGLSGELCEVVQRAFSGETGDNFIEIVVPKLPPAVLEKFDKHTLTIQYRPKALTNAPWQSQVFSYGSLQNGSVIFNGLVSNTLYAIKLQWQATGPAGASQNCSADLIETPTTGPNQIGPRFRQNPLNVTLPCSSKPPYPIPFPEVTGGCSTPRLTYTDAPPTGDACNRVTVRTWVAVDNCGRSCSGTQTIAFVDRQAPRFIDLPASSGTLECGENLPTEAPAAVDNCGQVTLTYNQQEQTQGNSCAKTVVRTWTATDQCGNSAVYTQTITVRAPTEEPNGEDPRVPPLPVKCGQNYTPPTVGNTNPLPSAQPGQFFYIAGFPILLESVNGGNGTFSGIGKARIPFTKKVVLVEFSSVSVNTARIIYQGSVSGISDPTFLLPSGGNIDLGGDICLPEPELSAAGFNEQGVYVREPPYEGWTQGDPIDPQYDPNGYDANGYHRSTGDKYNEEGCDQNGLDKNGDPCNPGTKPPYSWLRDLDNPNGEKPPITTEGTALATTLQPSLRNNIEAAINTLLQQNTNDLTVKKAQCGTVRSELETTAGSLDKKYLFGANNEYLNEGMSLQFKSTPVPLQIHVPDRAAQIKNIETKHIELYYCDKLVQKFKQIELILTQFKAPYDLDILAADALDALKRLPAAQANDLKDNAAKQTEWILDFVLKALQKELKNRGLAVLENPGTPGYRTPLPSGAPADQQERPWRFLAAANDPGMPETLLATMGEPSENEQAFAFRQGYEYIGNTHRAFFLEAIVQARKVAGGDGGNGQDPENLMPIRIEKTAGGRTYTILLDKIQFTTQGATLNAYCIVAMPNSEQRLVFRALNVPFTPGGMGPDGIRLTLESNIGIRLNNTAKLHLIGNSGDTYVKWDCEGFAGMKVKAEIEFCRNYFTPLTPALEVDNDPSARVKAYFTAEMPAWGEFIATLQMDPFALTKHPDYKWQIQGASIDFSDSRNPDNFSNITANYSSEFGNPGSGFKTQWKGFFLESLTVTVPKKFQKNGSAPIRISAQKLVIDDRGVTGILAVEAPLVPLSEGSLGGWAFSMDRFRLAVVTNRVQGGGFGGLIHVPIFGAPGNQGDPTEADCFRYSASIIATPTAEFYEFAVQPAAGPLDVGIWVGKATLKANSSLRVKYANGIFDILANLNGELAIDGELGSNTPFKVPALAFQNVALSNHAPYLLGGSFGLPATVGAKIGGFSLTIKLPQLGPGGNGANCSLEVGADLRLVGGNTEDDRHKLNFGAGTAVILNGEMVPVNGRQRWRYKDFDLRQINLAASWKGVSAINGSLTWYKADPVFGRGFRGMVSVRFEGLNKLSKDEIGVDAVAQFGSKDDYKYFMVDALAHLGAGIEMGGLRLKAIGGGAYYHMDRDSTAFLGLGGAGNGVPTLPTSMGASLSGIRYTPNSAIGLGLKAAVVLAASGNEEAFNAAVTFEIRFNAPTAGGGIKDIALYGNAKFMAKLELAGFTGTPTPAAPMAATAYILFDFANQTLHGDLKVFANVNGIFVGAGGGDLVGNAVLHFSPSVWYIHIGTPSQRVGIAINIPIGDRTLNLIRMEAYLCMGTGIPPMPELPPYVREIRGSSGNFMANESARASGRGFAFGASIQVGTPKLKFLIFYGQLEGGMGFDLMLQQYEGLNCDNTGGGPIGINGWYASGQAWTYIDADIGLVFRGKEFSILRVGVASAIRMKLPNPFWARITVDGKFRLLGGLLKGPVHFKAQFGKSCEEGENSDDALQFVKMIEALEPKDKTKLVETAAKPTAFFNVPVNGSFTVIDDSGNETEYTTTLTKFMLKNADGSVVPAEVIVSADKRQVTYQTKSLLAGNAVYKFEVEVKCYKNGFIALTETNTAEFTTGPTLTTIPQANIASSYPLNGMYNLYKKEAADGFIKLKDAQPELLQNANLVARFINKNGSSFESPISISANGKVLNFPLPQDLTPNQFYQMQVVLLSASPSNGSGNSEPSASQDEPQERILHQLFFRTSIYDRFADKMDILKQGTRSIGNLNMSISANMEPFDNIELFGNGLVPPLIQYQNGATTHSAKIDDLYAAMASFEYRPSGRPIPQNGVLKPATYIKMAVTLPANTILRAEYDGFAAGNAGIGNVPVNVVNSLYYIADDEARLFKFNHFSKVNDECGVCTGSSASGNNCDMPGTNPSYPRCCCSETYIKILNNNTVKNLYTNWTEPARPAANSNHPIFFSYQLPGTTNYTTSGIKVDFRY